MSGGSGAGGPGAVADLDQCMGLALHLADAVRLLGAQIVYLETRVDELSERLDRLESERAGEAGDRSRSRRHA